MVMVVVIGKVRLGYPVDREAYLRKIHSSLQGNSVKVAARHAFRGTHAELVFTRSLREIHLAVFGISCGCMLLCVLILPVGIGRGES